MNDLYMRMHPIVPLAPIMGLTIMIGMHLTTVRLARMKKSGLLVSWIMSECAAVSITLWAVAKMHLLPGETAGPLISMVFISTAALDYVYGKFRETLYSTRGRHKAWRSTPINKSDIDEILTPVRIARDVSIGQARDLDGRLSVDSNRYVFMNNVWRESRRFILGGRPTSCNSPRMKNGYCLKWILLGLLVVSCVVFYRDGLDLGLHRNATERMRYHAIPVALAQVLYEWPHDYTSFNRLALPFQSQDRSINALLLGAASPPGTIDPADSSVYFWLCDDRGSSDLVNLSFRVFGQSMRGLYKGFFLLLAVSLLFAVLSLWKDYCSLALLVVFIVSYVGVLPMFLTVGGLSLWTCHITETRALECLGLLYVLQAVCLTFRNLPLSPRALFGLIGQGIIFGFLYSCRSSLGWIALAVTVMTVIVIVRLIVKKYKGFSARSFIWAILMPLILLGSIFMFKAWHHLAEHPYYLSGGGQRTFYHNALMGLYRSEVFKTQYQLTGPDDRAAIEAVNLWLSRSGKKMHSADDLLNALGGHGSADWAVYEKDARSMFWYLVRKEPLGALMNYCSKLTDSLVSTRASLATIIQVHATNNKRWLEFHPHPLRWDLILLGLLPAFVAGYTFRHQSGLLSLMLFVYLFALIPSVLFYPAFLTQTGADLLIRMFFYVAFIQLTLYTIRSFKPIFSTRSFSCESTLSQRYTISARVLLAVLLNGMFWYYFLNVTPYLLKVPTV